MRHLIIKNVGPIRSVSLDFTRFNFFIGPQSSGKSTIAKIYSTCSWVEKEVATTMNATAIADAPAFLSLMVDFHKMTDYFDQSSEVLFETDVISISLKGMDFHLILKNQNLYRREKICYIPSERHAVTLPELEGLEFGQTNLRSFLFDWFNARELYVKENKADILNLGVCYYYDPGDLRYKDRIEHSNGMTYQIPLGSASSGLQSVVPLQVMMQYYSSQYFDSFSKKASFDFDAKARAIRRRLTESVVLKELFPDFNPADPRKYVEKANELIHNGDEKALNLLHDYQSAVERLTVPVRSSFIVEEPEQNLFPDSQMDLLDSMIAMCSGEKAHSLTITTHSPYILNRLNLLFKRFDKGVKDTIGVNYEDVSVYAIDNGSAVNLKIGNAHLVNPEYLSAPLDRIYSEYDSIR